MQRLVFLFLAAFALAGCAGDEPDLMFQADEIPGGFRLVPIHDPPFDNDFMRQLDMTSNPGKADFSWRESTVHAGLEHSRVAVYERGDFLAVGGVHTFPDQQTASKWAFRETHCDDSPLLQKGASLIFFEPLEDEWSDDDAPALRAMIRDHMARTGSVDLCSSVY